ncbi:MAG: hypothetical protein WC651_00545 [Candidatus Gracilibacteria bacterium]|jgi:hypothetical protein
MEKSNGGIFEGNDGSSFTLEARRCFVAERGLTPELRAAAKGKTLVERHLPEVSEIDPEAFVEIGDGSVRLSGVGSAIGSAIELDPDGSRDLMALTGHLDRALLEDVDLGAKSSQSVRDRIAHMTGLPSGRLRVDGVGDDDFVCLDAESFRGALREASQIMEGDSGAE